jgi:16S rRNA processing protein RimM
MGRVAGPYGVRGWVKVAPFTEATDTLAGHATWWLGRNAGGDAVAFRVEAARQHADAVVAKLAGVDSRESAAALRGSLVLLPRNALPAPRGDEVYLGDLVGAAVVNRKGESLGTVESADSFGAHPVLRVVDDGGTARLIPFVPAYVDAVDLDAGRVEVDWGLDY